MSNAKQRTKLLLSWMNKISTARPILRKAAIQKVGGRDRMIITDAYMVFYLNDDLPELPHVEPQDGNYPVMENLYNDWLDRSERENPRHWVVDVDILKQAIKDKNQFVRVGGCMFSAKMIKRLIDVMGTNTLTVSYGRCTGAHVHNTLGYAMVLGCREETKNEDLIEVATEVEL